MPMPPPSLKGRVLRQLSMREHSRLELERKLQRHETEPGQLGEVLDELQAKGFIDARRVVDSVVHQRAAKLGLARIRQELQHKGIDAEVSRDALAALQVSELARAQVVWRKKFGHRDTEREEEEVEAGERESPAATRPDAAQRARQMRFLAARGFTGDTIRRVVSGADDMPDEPMID